VGSHLRAGRKQQHNKLERVFEYFPVLADKRAQRSDELSGGQQQMLAIGRGIMADPAVLLLDEPSEGLAPVIVTQVFQAIRQLAKEGSIAVLLAEQNAGVLEVCDTGMLMRNGELSAPRPVDATSESELADYIFELST
jgi:branched-chain amino acid transport system ATP-binding protein